MAIKKTVCRYFPKEPTPPCEHCKHYIEGVSGVHPITGQPLPTRMCSDVLSVLALMDGNKALIQKTKSIDKFNNTVDSFEKEAKRLAEGLALIPHKQIPHET